MKVLVIHSAGSGKVPEGSVDQRKKIQVRRFQLTEGQESLSGKELRTLTAGVSHILFFVRGNIRPGVVSFFVGFSEGTNIPLVFIGKLPARNIPPEIASLIRILQNEEELEGYLSKALKVWEKDENRRRVEKARLTLLSRGIPLSNEALASCAEAGDLRGIKTFLQAGFSPDTRNALGVPILHLATREGRRETVKYLIAQGADINLCSNDRNSSALFDAAMGKYVDILRDLIAAGADLNIRSKDGQSALILSVGFDDEACAEVLLLAGADADTPDCLGVSARGYANLFQKPGMTALFEKYSPVKAGN